MKHVWRYRTATMKTLGGPGSAVTDTWTECTWCRVHRTEDNTEEECRVRTEVKANGGYSGSRDTR